MVKVGDWSDKFRHQMIWNDLEKKLNPYTHVLTSKMFVEHKLVAENRYFYKMAQL